MRSIKNETNLQGKKILLRLDLNVPLVNGKISDTNRIDKILPTLRFLNKQKTKIIVANPGIKSYQKIIESKLDVVLYNNKLLDLYCLKNWNWQDFTA